MPYRGQVRCLGDLGFCIMIDEYPDCIQMPGISEKMDRSHQITNGLVLRSQKTKLFFEKLYRNTFLIKVDDLTQLEIWHEL